MTKSTITRERIQRIIRAIDSEAYDEEEIREWLSSDEIMELSRMALAAMDSELVYQCEFTHADVSGELQWHWEDVNEAFYERYGSGPRGQRRILYSVPQPAPQPGPVMESEPVAEVLSNRQGNDTSTIDRALPVGTQLYRHAQPVVPPMQHWEELCRQYPDMSIRDAIIRVAWWNHCRAAMLQPGNSPVTPDGKSATAPTGIPVIPDGYVMVPKEPTEEMNKAGWSAMNEHDAINPTYRAMLAAAQHDTPALNSLQSVDSVTGGWIPVSERMPEDRISVILWDAEIGEVTSGHYSHKTQTFYHCGDAIENEITHWMPPPCAPQEVKGEHQIRDEMDMGARITSHRFKV